MRVLAWAMGLAALTACVKTERDYQLEYARQLAPKQRVAAPSSVVPKLPAQPPRVFTVRAYVDLDYRAQVLHWNERVTALVAAASARTKEALNVRLELVSLEPWDRRSERTPMTGSLTALARQDPARDVDLVVGFVSSLEIFSESQEQLGFATVLGKHAVVRAMDNAAEHQAITRVFTRLDEREREALYRERKLHKETAVFLHEWGHLLGAPHDLAGESYLNPVYAVQRARFPPMTLEVLAKALELRDEKADRKTRARAVGELVASAPDTAWSLQDRDAVLAGYERIARGEDAHEAEALSQRDRQLVADARRLEAKGQFEEALAVLEPLLGRDPPVAPAHGLACQLAGVISLSAPRTRERCEAALALDDTDAGAWLMLAQHQAATKDLAAARRSFLAAKDRFTQPSVEGAAALAAVARTLGFVTWAEQLASRAPGRTAAEQALEWATRRRRWYGLQPGASSPAPADEPLYLERFMKVQDALSRAQLPEAEQLITALEKDHPGLVGPLTLRCELAMRRGQDARARAACEQAVAAWPDSLEGHYLLGVLASLARQHRRCVEHLELVVEQDPTVDDAWERLEKAWGALGDAANRERAAKRRPRQ